MLSNDLYNLIEQLATEAKSLHRINTCYMEDCAGDEEAMSYWKELAADKEEHIEDLLGMIKEMI